MDGTLPSIGTINAGRFEYGHYETYVGRAAPSNWLAGVESRAAQGRLSVGSNTTSWSSCSSSSAASSSLRLLNFEINMEGLCGSVFRAGKGARVAIDEGKRYIGGLVGHAKHYLEHRIPVKELCGPSYGSESARPYTSGYFRHPLGSASLPLVFATTSAAPALSGAPSGSLSAYIAKDGATSGVSRSVPRKTVPRRDPNGSSGPEFARGAIAAFVNIVATFPINKLMFRYAAENLTLWQAARSMRKEGWRHLYRGLAPPLAQKMLTMSCMFGLYDYFLKKTHQFGVFDSVPAAQQLTAALLAGSTEAILTPLERVQTVLQHRHFTSRYENMMDAFIKLRSHGLREYYRGTLPILLRNGPANAMYFIFREPVRDMMPVPVGADGKPSHAWQIGRNFVTGALLGAGISTLFFPLNVIKSVVQSQVGGPHPSLWGTFRTVHRERGGFYGLFRGVHVNYTRSLVSWGIINSVYEFLQDYDFGDGGPAPQAPQAGFGKSAGAPAGGGENGDGARKRG